MTARVWPVEAWSGRRSVVSDGFRRFPTAHRQHLGVDIMWKRAGQWWPASADTTRRFVAPRNAVAVASLGGIVVASREQSNGGRVDIKEDGGMLASYLHLAERAVAVGDRLETGDKVGVLGAGPASPIHLHFALRYAGHWLDPEPQLAQALHIAPRWEVTATWVVAGTLAFALGVLVYFVVRYKKV